MIIRVVVNKSTINDGVVASYSHQQGRVVASLGLEAMTQDRSARQPISVAESLYWGQSEEVLLII